MSDDKDGKPKAAFSTGDFPIPPGSLRICPDPRVPDGVLICGPKLFKQFTGQDAEEIWGKAVIPEPPSDLKN